MLAEALWALGEVLAAQKQFMYCKTEEDRLKVHEVNRVRRWWFVSSWMEPIRWR